MGPIGHDLATITSLKNNRALLKGQGPFKSRKKETRFSGSPSGKKALRFKKSDPEELADFRLNLRHRNHKRNKRLLLAFLASMIISVVIMFILRMVLVTKIG